MEDQRVETVRDRLEHAVTDALEARALARRGAALVAREAAASAQGSEERRPAVLEHAYEQWNAMTLVAIFGAIEGHIEELAAGLYDTVTKSNEEKRVEILRRNRQRNAELRSESGLPHEAYQLLTKFSREVVHQMLPKPLRQLPRGEKSTSEKWEETLEGIYLGPIKDRPLPKDLTDTIDELGEIRHVLLHRLGRIDQKALERVVEGPWRSVGERVRISDDLYRRYIAALMAYYFELLDRVRDRFGLPPGVDIKNWRNMVPAGNE